MHKNRVKDCGWIKLPQDMAQWQDSMTMVIRLCIQKKLSVSCSDEEQSTQQK